MTIRPLLKLLFVGNEQENLKRVEAALDPLRAIIVHADSVAMASEVMQTTDFVVIIWDLSCFTLNSAAVAETVRTQSACIHTPILLLANSAYDSSVELACEHGPLDYVTMPVASGILTAKIELLISLSRVSVELAQYKLEYEPLAEPSFPAVSSGLGKSSWKERMQLALGNIRDYAIVVTDGSGYVTEWEGGASVITGWTAPEVIGKSLDFIFTLEDLMAGRPQEDREEAQKAGRVQHKRWHLRKDNSRFHADSVIVVLKDEDGRTLGFANILRDDTARRAVKEHLEANEERLRVATDAAEVGMWTWDIDRNLVTWDNERVYDIFGLPYGSEPVDDARFEADFIHPDDKHIFRQAVTKTLENGERFYFESRVYRPDGELRWLEFTGLPRKTADGSTLITGTSADITDRKLVEERIRASEERYRRLFNSIDEGFCTIDVVFDEAGQPVDYLFLDANPTFESQTGLVDVVGKTMLELVPNHDSHWFTIYGKVALTGEPVRFIEEAKALGRWFDLYAFRVGEAPSRTVAVLFKDITAQRQAQAEREHLLNEISAAHQQMSDVFQQAPAFMCVLRGPEHRFEMVNERYSQLIGGKRNIVGKSIAEALPEVVEQGFIQVLDKVFQTGVPYIGNDVPVRLQRSQRESLEERVVDFAYLPLRDAERHVTGIMVHGVDITDKKRAVERSQAADQRIQMALDAGAVAGTWFWDVVKDNFTSDARFARYFSLDPDTMARGIPLSQVAQSIHPDDEPRVMSQVTEVLERGGPYKAQYRVRQPDGAYRWIEANGHVTRNPEGQPLNFPGVLIDIEDLKRSEERQLALLALGNRLRHLGDSDEVVTIAAHIVGETLHVQRVGFGVVDPIRLSIDIAQDWQESDVISSISGRHYFKHYGSFVDDLILGKIVTVDDVTLDPRTADFYQALHAIQIHSLLNIPVLDHGSFAGVFLVHCNRSHNWTTDEISFVQSVADLVWSAITEAGATNALRKLNARLEQEAAERTADRNRLWQLSTDIMVVAQPDGHIIAVNPAWTEVLGWTENDLIGASLFDLVHPEDLETSKSFIKHVGMLEDKLTRFENRYRHRTDEYRWISWSARASDDFIIAVGRDVTEEKQRAILFEKMEDKLRHSQKMDAVGQLTGGLAHDFNNLLASISGNLELLNLKFTRGDFQNLERFTQNALKAVRNAASLTHRLLAFSRQQTLDAKPTDINRLVDEMMELIRRSIGPSIALEFSADPGLWPSLVDGNQLENALLNLCINARDAMPDGGILRINTANKLMTESEAERWELSAGEYVTLSVTDNGTGMSPDVIAKAFDPFFTTKPIGKGTGLGLSMIYGFVRQSGGHVDIESAVGKGTTMRLYLPRHHAQPENIPEHTPVVVPRATDKVTVLIVDDEVSVRAVVKELLNDLGYITLEAGDGASALQLIQSTPYLDLLVSDVGLAGGMSGRQLADAARNLRPELAILFITGYTELKIVEPGDTDKTTQFMTKPFQLEAFASRVKEMTSKS